MIRVARTGESRDDHCRTKPRFPRHPNVPPLCRPEEMTPRHLWGDRFIREVLDPVQRLHGEAGTWLEASRAKQPTSARHPVVDEWIERAERHRTMVELSADL